MTRRIGIYGGSFNPIHNGHTLLGAALCDMGYVDELWFVVSPMNPLKQDVQSELLPDAERLRLCRLAVVDDPRLLVSDVEFSMPRPSYMADTLALLRNIHSDKEFILVIGSDNWLNFNRWSRPGEIQLHHRILIFPRPGYPVDTAVLPNGVTGVDTPLMNLSSTQIRHAIHTKNFNGEGLSPAVWQEIQTKHYYL